MSASGQQPIVELRGVSKRFSRRLGESLRLGVVDMVRDAIGLAPRRGTSANEFWALRKATLTLARGECLGILGINGAGKSTLLKLVSGLMKPDQGEIRTRGRVGALIELGAGMHPNLTGRENIRVGGAMLGFTSAELEERMDAIIEFADLGEFIDAPTQSYSSGMRVRLGFAVASHLDPDLLLVDEVLAVGDTRFRMRCFERLRSLRERGTAIMLVSHNTTDIERMCTRCIVLQSGAVVFDGPMEESLGHYEASLPQEREPAGANRSIARFAAIETLEESLETHATARFRIRIHSEKPEIPLRVLANLISPNLGVLGSVTSHGSLQLTDSTDYEVLLEFPRLPLQLGGYAVHFWLYGPDITDFFDVTMRHRLRITGPRTDSFGYAPSHSIRFETNWTLL